MPFSSFISHPSSFCMNHDNQPRFLITAGPTREFLDPVRFISNPSTGKMGFAIAQAARKLSRDVTLISGPTHLQPPRRVRFASVVSAVEMFAAVKQAARGADIV